MSPSNETGMLGLVVAEMLGEQTGPNFATIPTTMRIDILGQLLGYRIRKVEDPPIRRSCRRLMTILPQKAVHRLLRAPAFCDALVSPGDGTELLMFLGAELALADPESSIYLDRWSALGDAWLGETPPGDLPLRATNGRWWSPRLACGIPLDLSLPAALRRPTAGLRVPRLLDCQETLETIVRLDEAIELLEFVMPEGHSAVVELTTNIVLRVDEGRPANACSASSELAIGRAVIGNPGAAGGPPFLAELLLHEAIHFLMACIKLKRPLIPDLSSIVDGELVSPWTGNTLTVAAFIDACVVWSVLLKYWSTYCEANADDVAAHHQYDLIRHGLECLDTRRSLGPFEGCLSPTALRLVDRAREAALS